jgi:hypothetical protein
LCWVGTANQNFGVEESGVLLVLFGLVVVVLVEDLVESVLVPVVSSVDF